MTDRPHVSVDLLVAEIGSTTTKVLALDGLLGPGESPRCLGRGMAATSVLEGDVTTGLSAALDDLAHSLGLPDRTAIIYRQMLASSSAAGGLRMSVHGLVYDMTVRAAREAALGAGAVVRMVTAGPLSEDELDELSRLKPNIILLAGGVDYGERDTAVANARLIAGLGLGGTPVVYAGNVAARAEAVGILERAGMRVTSVDNVYPRIDELSVEPARAAIQRVFEEHIVHAPGMERIRETVSGRIMPTPGAVMEAAILLYGELGDLVVVDPGGATTDVHSVTEGSEEIAALLIAPEPVAKRTVEGDLGVFLNAGRTRELYHPGELEGLLKVSAAELDRLLERLPAIPTEGVDQELAILLTRAAVRAAVMRHAGRLKHLYGPAGRTTVAEGKDLTRVKWIIGTGGPLTRLPGGEQSLGALRVRRRGQELLPGSEARVLLDRDYVMSSCGVIARDHPKAALEIMSLSLGLPAPAAG